MIPTVDVQLKLDWNTQIFQGFPPQGIRFRGLGFSIPGMSISAFTDQMCDAGQAVIDIKDMPSTGMWQGVSCAISVNLVGNDGVEYNWFHPTKPGTSVQDNQSSVIYLDNWTPTVNV